MARSPTSKIASPYEDQRTITLPSPDYDADDVMVVREADQLKALGGELRSQIVILLRDRARSTTELAAELGTPKGTVGHHVKVLEQAGLLRVVRTRKVRAVTERYYGRTARLFLFHDDEPADGSTAEARLTPADARRLAARLERLLADFRAADSPGGEPFSLAAELTRVRHHA